MSAAGYYAKWRNDVQAHYETVDNPFGEVEGY